ncbi:outer membrane lipoprotein-sorting protein [Sandarakinorhabdus sp.]|uniref:outer membrane lipoprotein-sorting protein n=1 Tax=Sandarakinorhabdus sp. TaxID=1916663 RepID=UPI00286E9F60|nr:outer membrane lipoprotein-sorting protein [Sandarakinorhabdus sp.]
MPPAIICPLSRRQFAFGLAGAGLSGIAFPRPAFAADDPALALMTTAYEATRFAAARFAATLTHQPRPDVRQARALAGATKLIEGGRGTARLLRFTTPADMRGVATLTIERSGSSDDLWIFLPALRRVRRLVSSNRADPWVGSEFSLGDIIGHKVGDWHHRLVQREPLGAASAIRIESVPASARVASDTGYSKRVTWLREADAATLRVDFHDQTGAPMKSLLAGDIATLDADKGKIQPMRLTMRNLRGGGVSTLAFSQFRINAAITDAELAPQALQS